MSAQGAGEGRAAPRKPRSDAERNRQRILAGAREVYREVGPGASLDSVAVAAGVGSATLYRHFPDPSSLLTAVLRLRLQEVDALLTDLADERDAWRALERYVRALASTADNALADALVLPPEQTPEVAEHREKIRPAVRRLLQRAQEEGVLRPDYTVEDLGVFLFAHARAAASPHIDEGAATRLLDDYLSGLRSGCGTAAARTP